jgi:hypothetical protein
MVAASSGHVPRGAILLATYALGMAAPLCLLATLWDRFDLGRWRWLRGRELSLGRLRLYPMNVVSGLLFILLGFVYITYEGTSTLAGLYEKNRAEDLALFAERWVSSSGNSTPNVLVLAAAVLVTVTALKRRKRGRVAVENAKKEKLERANR